ncbi:Dam family site-specific DNA-(adenine-N6)-methyltransferase [Mycoplasma sp. 888]|uniref:Dam family site-specific DNA-(adenine-N6)-methyltransferase n=1 Tax=Mycoplasma sp. 888 TaxID=3108483 RepID=UPI002D783D31|nr:Dam family site-specific DNA-(adenine-N6)-methyltransferase [Mycoplasma sp. 888]WRQ25695.1 Dam family site-specific DNA-(adenine-N6)-methyltransferase [Mycoplasma sp. 888]
MILTNFAKRLNELRIQKLLTQQDLADLSKIERTQISKIEKGKMNITLETVEKLANALNVRVQDLFDFSTIVITENSIRPFVKWAGGKTQILDKLKTYIPEEFNDYYEPFVGGGALVFDLRPEVAYINDVNEELINVYQCFLNNKLFEKFKQELKKHEQNHSEEYYYQIREMDRLGNYSDLPIETKAGRMLYLNKACFNGLYRVNSKGYFNVPSGKKEKVTTFDESNFKQIKKYIDNNKFVVTKLDFEDAVKNAKAGDFVYLDPPYDVFPDRKGFVNYGKDGFGKDEQIRLRDCFVDLTKRGVKVMLSNHNTPFINEIYQGFNIYVIDAKRLINSKSDGRGPVKEVIIVNYSTNE